MSIDGVDELARLEVTGNRGGHDRWQLNAPFTNLFAWVTAAEARQIADAWMVLAADLSAREGLPGWALAPGEGEGLTFVEALASPDHLDLCEATS